MQKQKAILKIKSFSHKDGELLLYTDDYSVRAMLKGITDLCSDKYGGFIRLEMSDEDKKKQVITLKKIMAIKLKIYKEHYENKMNWNEFQTFFRKNKKQILSTGNAI